MLLARLLPGHLFGQQLETNHTGFCRRVTACSNANTTLEMNSVGIYPSELRFVKGVVHDPFHGYTVPAAVRSACIPASACVTCDLAHSVPLVAVSTMDSGENVAAIEAIGHAEARVQSCGDNDPSSTLRPGSRCQLLFTSAQICTAKNLSRLTRLALGSGYTLHVPGSGRALVRVVQPEQLAPVSDYTVPAFNV